MNTDETEPNDIDDIFLRVAKGIATEIESTGEKVPVESILRAIKLRNPNSLDRNSLPEKKEQIKALESAINTLGRAQRKLEGAGINAGHVADVVSYYEFLLHLRRVSIGREKLTLKGGINWPAREVAKMVARAFAYHGVKVTFGVGPAFGGPTTAFGRAVANALYDFGVIADWRRAAEAGRDYAREYEKELRQAQEDGHYR